MKTKNKNQNRPAQLDSGNSILKPRPYRPLVFKNRPAQRDSGMSKLDMGLIGPMGRIGPMGKEPVNQNGPAQRDSEISKLAVGRTSQTEPQCTPAQRDSGNSILGVGILGILRSLGIMGEQPIVKTCPAQRDSKMSNLGAGRTSQTCPTSQTEPQRSPAQRDSGMSILGMELIGPMGPIGLMGKKPVMKNSPAQAGSKNSKLDFPLCLCDSVVKAVQRDSKIYKIMKSGKKLQFLLIFILIIVAWNGRVNICDLILNA